jgi:hypothetical protein
MCGSAGTADMPDVKSPRAFFRFEILHQDQQLEMGLESRPDFSHSEMCAPRSPFSGMRLGRIFPLPFLWTSSVAAFRGPNVGKSNGACFATSRQANEIIAPEAPHSHAVLLLISPNPSSEGEGCMKDTNHPIRHPLRHPRIFGRVQSRRDCTRRNDQFGRGQNTGLGRSDPTFVHVSVPKVIRGVAPAQLRVDRAECFVRTAFRSRRPQ